MAGTAHSKFHFLILENPLFINDNEDAEEGYLQVEANQEPNQIYDNYLIDTYLETDDMETADVQKEMLCQYITTLQQSAFTAGSDSDE